MGLIVEMEEKKKKEEENEESEKEEDDDEQNGNTKSDSEPEVLKEFHNTKKQPLKKIRLQFDL